MCVPRYSTQTRMPKLSIFKASDAPIALIVRRANKGKDWQLIRWDMQDDTFDEGQWIRNKHLWIDGCSLSSDGQYFYWIYNLFCTKDKTLETNDTHAGVSNVPYFTALMYGNKGMGRWDRCRFDKTTKKPINNQGLRPNDPEYEIECVESGTPDSTGLIKELEWFDDFGRSITIVEYQIFVNNHLHYDSTNNTFQNIKFPKVPEC